MGINDWFTVVGIFLAVYALYSSEEREVIRLKLSKCDLHLLVANTFFILLLIKYDDILLYIPQLTALRVESGIHSSNWAVLILLLTAVYFLIKLQKVTKKKIDTPLVNFYSELMKYDFKKFYELFNKYERKISEKHLSIVFSPTFLQLNKSHPYFYLNYFNLIDSDTFKQYFKVLIDNYDSIFYCELKANSNSYSVEQNNIFLYTTLHEQSKLAMEAKVLKIIQEWYLIHLDNEILKGPQSLYNQTYNTLLDDYELRLPLYYHIQFVQLLYLEAIIQKIDIAELDEDSNHLHTFFCLMVKKCIEGIDGSSKNQKPQNELSNYHYLIKEIFNVINLLSTEFNSQANFQNDSSYVSFFSTCMSLCIGVLVDGQKKRVISSDFLCETVHIFLKIYYKQDLHESFRKEIDEKCIASLPKNIITPLFTYSLKEKYALHYDHFKNHKKNNLRYKKEEKKIICRLHSILKTNELI